VSARGQLLMTTHKGRRTTMAFVVSRR